MKKALRVLTSIGMVFLFGTGIAQETHTPITAENATQLAPQYSIGSALPGKLAFSPDGRRIAIGTSEQTFVYDALELDVDPPVVFTFSDFEFNVAGELIAEGKRWNMRTGLSNGIAAAIHVHPPTTEQPNTVVEVVKPGGETIRVDTGFPYAVLDTVVNEEYSIAAVVMRPAYPLYGDTTIYLFRLPSGQMIASFPQGNQIIRNLLFIAGNTLIADFWIPRAGGGYINIYDARNGVPSVNFMYSETGVRLTPDSKTVLFTSGQSMFMVLGEGVQREFSFSPEDYEDFPPLHALGKQHVAIAKRDFIDIFDLQSTAEPTRIPVSEEDNGVSFSLIDDDRKLLLKTTPPRILNLEQPDAPPVELNVDGGYFQSINDDATRYIVRLYDGELSVRDIETGETLADLPNDAVINASYSQAVYWQGGQVVARDLINDQPTELDVIDGYLSKVAGIHAPTGVGVFAGQTVTLADLETKAVETIDAPFVPDSIDFNDDGTRMMLHRHYKEAQGRLPALALWDVTAEEGYMDFGDDGYELWALSPSGRYLVKRPEICEWTYGGIPYAYLFDTFAAGDTGLQPLVYSPGLCSNRSFAFTEDDETIYAHDAFHIYALQSDELDAGQMLHLTNDLEHPTAILDYQVEAQNETYEVIRGIVLSPDEQRLAVIVQTWSYSEVAPPLGVRIEIFDVEELHTGARRIDTQPSIVIENASIPMFSPDSETIATNGGIFRDLYGAKQTVDATISAFTGDSQLLATYQDDHVTLWNAVQLSEYPLAQYEVTGVRELGFSSDGTSLYVVRDGDIQVWQVDER